MNYYTPRNLALLQGTFYFLTGIWPILHIDSFMAVTGPKYDIWLVKTVGMLIVAVSLALLTAGIKDQVNQSIIILAAGAALGFILIDVIYVSLDVIAPVYLLDAVAEGVLLFLWGVLYFRHRNEFSEA